MSILKSLTAQPWLMEPTALRQMFARVSRETKWPTPGELKGAAEARRNELRKSATTGGNVAVIPVQGVVEQRLSFMGWLFGSAPTEIIGELLDSVIRDKQFSAVVLDVDSPGGGIAGVEELADQIFAARKIKPIVAFTNSLMASAALWIGSSATTVSSTPGGATGSLGVYTVHEDMSKALEQAGVSITIVSAGKFKTELAPTGPLNPDARSYLQAGVDATYAKFLGAVARGRNKTRGTVASDFGQGRLLDADQAIKVGMIDRIEVFPNLISRLLYGNRQSTVRATAPTLSEMRAMHQRRKEHERMKQETPL